MDPEEEFLRDVYPHYTTLHLHIEPTAPPDNVDEDADDDREASILMSAAVAPQICATETKETIGKKRKPINLASPSSSACAYQPVHRERAPQSNAGAALRIPFVHRPAAIEPQQKLIWALIPSTQKTPAVINVYSDVPSDLPALFHSRPKLKGVEWTKAERDFNLAALLRLSRSERKHRAGGKSPLQEDDAAAEEEAEDREIQPDISGSEEEEQEEEEQRLKKRVRMCAPEGPHRQEEGEEEEVKMDVELPVAHATTDVAPLVPLTPLTIDGTGAVNLGISYIIPASSFDAAAYAVLRATEDLAQIHLQIRTTKSHTKSKRSAEHHALFEVYVRNIPSVTFRNKNLPSACTRADLPVYFPSFTFTFLSLSLSLCL